MKKKLSILLALLLVISGINVNAFVVKADNESFNVKWNWNNSSFNSSGIDDYEIKKYVHYQKLEPDRYPDYEDDGFKLDYWEMKIVGGRVMPILGNRVNLNQDTWLFEVPTKYLDGGGYRKIECLNGETLEFKAHYKLCKPLIIKYYNGTVFKYQQEIYEGGLIRSVRKPTKDGYTFKHWADEDGDVLGVKSRLGFDYDELKYKLYINNGQYKSFSPNATHRVYAVWERNEDQHQDDGDNNQDQNQDDGVDNQDPNAEKISITYYEDGQEYRHEELSPGEFLLLGWNPEPFGKEFDYWKTENGKKLEGDVKVEKHDTLGWILATRTDNFITNISGNSLKINAVWKEGVGIPRHKVSFDTNGGNAMNSIEVESGQAMAVPMNPVKEGYTFKHWEINGRKYDFSWLVTHDLTLKAVWEQNPAGTVAVIFDAKGGTPVPAVQNVMIGAKAKRPQVNPTKAGYEFVDWYTSAGKYDFNKKIERKLKLFAKYKKAGVNQSKCKRQDLNIADADYNKAIMKYKKPFFEGNPDGTFKPEGTITRAEMATVFARVLGIENKRPRGSKNFSDISNHWGKKHIQLVAEYGLLDGYPNGTFRPEGEMTRAEICAMISKYWQLKGFNATASSESVSDINGHWAKDMVLKLENHGFVDFERSGNTLQFRPDDPLKRAYVARILNRMVDRPIINVAPIYVDVPSSYWGYQDINTASSKSN